MLPNRLTALGGNFTQWKTVAKKMDIWDKPIILNIFVKKIVPALLISQLILREKLHIYIFNVIIGCHRR